MAEAAEPAQLLAQVADLGAQLVRARHALEDRAQPLDVDRLHDVVGRARAQRVDRAFDRRMAGDHHHFGRLALLEIVDELDAVAVGKLQIGQQHVGPHLRQLNARGAQRARFGDGEPFAFDELGQPFELFGVVVYEQDVWHRASFYSYVTSMRAAP